MGEQEHEPDAVSSIAPPLEEESQSGDDFSLIVSRDVVGWLRRW